ncbi:CLUMA_CG006712, isoform A [Clunio marinus]|uniref:CLUMA_CG006712, isoform A n=1 Tax=Clunio marinus TaxID=568069 RepID=A0A1J1HZH4_9DIPT|nr:CLUMA_CG006712, isoform A [Clunio marinus]
MDTYLQGNVMKKLYFEKSFDKKKHLRIDKVPEILRLWFQGFSTSYENRRLSTGFKDFVT